MTDHIDDSLRKLQDIDPIAVSTEFFPALDIITAELRRLQKLVYDCAPYLWTQDQTPAEALKMWEEDRNRFVEDA